MNTNKTGKLKPMEVYHKMTPVRSIQQSINLIRALKNEQKEEMERSRPKSVFNALTLPSDTYGQIPNLREPIVQKPVFLPVKKSLRQYEKIKSVANSTTSPHGGFFRRSANMQALSDA